MRWGTEYNKAASKSLNLNVEIRSLVCVVELASVVPEVESVPLSDATRQVCVDST